MKDVSTAMTDVSVDPDIDVSMAAIDQPNLEAGISIADDSASIVADSAKTAETFPPPKTDKPRPHICRTCERSFARLEHLKRHERSHTKEKPFECPVCERCFARRDLLLRHQQKLHQTSTPSSRPRHRRESSNGAIIGPGRVRKNSVVGQSPSVTAAAGGSMRPRANTISHVDGAAMQMMAAAATASAARAMPHSHSRHPSLGGPPMHNLSFDLAYGGSMAAAMGHRGLTHVLPRLETHGVGTRDSSAGLRTAPPMPFNPEFDIGGLYFSPGSTINPNALHYNDSPPSMALDPTSPYPQTMHDLASQAVDDAFDWLTGFENQMSFANDNSISHNSRNNENAIDGSSPSAISTTSQSGMSDVMLDGSNHNAPSGTTSMWHPSIIGPPQMLNTYAVDLNSSGFPDLINGTPISPHNLSRKLHDSYFSTPPPSMNSLSPTVMSSLNTQNLNQALSFNASPQTPNSVSGGAHGPFPTLPITEAARDAIIALLSQGAPPGGRRYSIPTLGSPNFLSASSANDYARRLPAIRDLQRYIGGYIRHFHPHLPFIHLPTLSLELLSSKSGRFGTAAATACLVLAMAAIGAVYEMDHVQSWELFDMAHKMIKLFLEERRRAEAKRADFLRNSTGFDQGLQATDRLSFTPVIIVQAVLLVVIYGFMWGDKPSTDIANAHHTALHGLMASAGLLKPSSMMEPSGRDLAMTDDGNWSNSSKTEVEEHKEWLRWKSIEEGKRTLFAAFIMSTLLLESACSHSPILTNSNVHLDLPCDEEFFSAETSTAFSAKGGIVMANHNRLPFRDALGKLFRTHQKEQQAPTIDSPIEPFGLGGNNEDVLLNNDLKPSTFGCLVLINALHNCIWDSRQRHHHKPWTADEMEAMHKEIAPALKAWQAAWSSNPNHSILHPHPAGLGPLSADSIPLLDLAYVRLFVDLSRSTERFRQRDWDGVAEELSRDGEAPQSLARSPTSNSESNATDPSENSIVSSAIVESPPTLPPSPEFRAMQASDIHDNSQASNRPTSMRERHLRWAACYAIDSLSMTEKAGFRFSELTRRELPIQSTICSFTCAQVVAEWIATLQDRVGRYLGILGRDEIDLTQVPAIVLLDQQDIKLLGKIQEVLAPAEMKLKAKIGLGNNSTERMEPHGFAARILGTAACLLHQATLWPVTTFMVRCLESQSENMKTRAEKSVLINP